MGLRVAALGRVGDDAFGELVIRKLAEAEVDTKFITVDSALKTLDLTPAAIGGLCVPPVNLETHAKAQAMNVNMISCAGQATIPMVNAVSRIQSVSYAEIIATVSSKSIGPGTRANLDEFTYTTSSAVCAVGGSRTGKALVIINPADPPMIMRNTIYCLTDETPDQERIRESVLQMVKEVQKYVPGYRLKNGPVFDGNRVTTFMEVEGLGDFLPKYAGNLDIMTASATMTAIWTSPRRRPLPIPNPTHANPMKNAPPTIAGRFDLNTRTSFGCSHTR